MKIKKRNYKNLEIQFAASFKDLMSFCMDEFVELCLNEPFQLC